jgi:hypothetical protein
LTLSPECGRCTSPACGTVLQARCQSATRRITRRVSTNVA